MTLQGFDSLKRKTRRMRRKLDKDPKQTVRRDLNKMEHQMKANVVEMDAVASTELFRSFRVLRTVAPGENATRFKLTNNAPYAAFVEHGTGPKGDGSYPAPAYGPRLIAGLKEWAIAKPTVNVTFIDAWAKEAAYTVSTKGTEEQPFFWPVWRSEKDVMLAHVRASVKHAVRHS